MSDSRREGDVWSHTITSKSEIHPPSWSIRGASVHIPLLGVPKYHFHSTAKLALLIISTPEEQAMWCEADVSVSEPESPP